MAKEKIVPNLRKYAVPIKSIAPDPANARRHSDANLDAIRGSLLAFGQQKPIVVDARGVIVAGNGLYQAARQLGWSRIAAIRTTLRGVDRMAYALADNRTAELAEWDDEALLQQLQELRDQVDLPALGFDEDELARLLHPGVEEGLTDPDDLPEPPDEATTQRGDVWVLGDHRLMCGDAGSTEEVDRLLDGAGAAMCFTDPPWNVAIGGDGNPRHRQRPGLLNDNLDPREFAEMLRRFARAMRLHLAGDLYCVLGASEWPTLDRCLRAEGYHWSATVIWVKDQFVLGRSKYHRRYEPIWYGWPNKSSFCGRRDLDDVWEIPRPRRSKEHPAMKPVELIVRAIQYSSRSGEKVLDLFGGSGSTLIACEQTGRHCFMMELDPLYCDVIVQRFEQFTGKKAKRVKGPKGKAAAAGVPKGKPAATGT